ncbi:MAG: TIGR04283 family arsenosugar biosynthesis glycosyltransferase [Alphaproteobacteria bacterium]|nr:TIGR04283 family arsenosugar biosynthesis glycosyltransferase [Alphaproteobacteria bacterium]
MPLSIIIPVLNEILAVEKCLGRLTDLRARGAEVIVVDGGSNDGTEVAAHGLADRVLTAPEGRASQMNLGARSALGDVLLFLHVDTELPPAVVAVIESALARSERIWGRFDVRIEPSSILLAIVARMMNLRSRLSGIATGDQAIFVRRSAFFEIGGYPEILLMEDIALSRTLKRLGWPICLRQKVTTSARRWLEYGVMRTILLMWRLRLAYFLWKDPTTLARQYGYGP